MEGVKFSARIRDLEDEKALNIFSNGVKPINHLLVYVNILWSTSLFPPYIGAHGGERRLPWSSAAAGIFDGFELPDQRTIGTSYNRLIRSQALSPLEIRAF